jgi:hypothetical protein
MAACGDDTSTPIDGGMDASKADVGGGSSSSGSGSSSSSSGGTGGGLDASNLPSCMTTMSAADCPMPRMQQCCAEMPIPTLVCKPRTVMCGIFQLCEQDTECPSGQACKPMVYQSFPIHVCSAAMSSDGGGGDAAGAGDSESGSGSDAGDSGSSSDTGTTDAPTEGG